ncbi:MAG: hypothetical protein NE328_14940 [Lentisphaeraceae bacterium]|nr:hypothetical protein [Lentisphaeraceae bacterium]
MAAPDFSKKTIDTLAKRAAYRCSNTNCRVLTIGPNSEDEKSTTIGEAAHIFGARLSSKRYSEHMTDPNRAEITNAIWLCRNCHKKIDTDEDLYSPNLLFEWRRIHDEYILGELGSPTDRIRQQEIETELVTFKDCPPIVKRIVIDKPYAWEHRLTAELMRHFNDPIFKRMDDLKDGLYLQQQSHLRKDEISDWIHEQLSEMQVMLKPLEKLIYRLNSSWGELGKAGDQEEIYRITSLMRDYLRKVVEYEEKVYFTNPPDDYKNLVNLFKNLVGSQVEKLRDVPDRIDDRVSSVPEEDRDKNVTLNELTITFDFPKDLEKKFNKEIKWLHKNNTEDKGCLSVCFSLIGFLCILALIIAVCK